MKTSSKNNEVVSLQLLIWRLCYFQLQLTFCFYLQCFFQQTASQLYLEKTVLTVQYVRITACLIEETDFFSYLVENIQRYLTTLLKQEHYQKKQKQRLLIHFLYGLINISENSNILHEYIKLLQGDTSILKPYQHQ